MLIMRKIFTLMYDVQQDDGDDDDDDDDYE